MKELERINAVDLRRLADGAASLRGPRGLKSFLVPNGEFGAKIVPGPSAQPSNALLELNTAFQRPDRPPVDSLIIESGGQPLELHTLYDAVFWTEASVEKFVFPYLASKSLWLAAYVLEGLAKVWYGFVPVPPLLSPQEPSAMEIPFAIAHLPSSDYVPLESELGGELHLLVKMMDGTIEGRPLSAYLVPRAES